MSREQNKTAQTRFAEAALSGNYQGFYDVVAPRSIDHDPAPGQVPGPDGFKQVFTELHTAFPDLDVQPVHVVVDDDNMAFAYTMTGTNQGPFLGFAPTGKKFKIHGLQISKFVNGQLVERWGSSDQLGILQQLGLFPGPPS